MDIIHTHTHAHTGTHTHTHTHTHCVDWKANNELLCFNLLYFIFFCFFLFVYVKGVVTIKFNSNLMKSQVRLDSWFPLQKRPGKPKETVSGQLHMQIQYGDEIKGGLQSKFYSSVYVSYFLYCMYYIMLCLSYCAVCITIWLCFQFICFHLFCFHMTSGRYRYNLLFFVAGGGVLHNTVCVSVCVCVCVCMYVCVCVYNIHIYVCVCVRVCICIYIYIYIYMIYIYIYIYIYVNIYIYIFIYIYSGTSTYACQPH